MIQIEDIVIKEFRGIRDLKLQPNSRSFLVWGPNGVGKSGVVDALDFALTGKVSRLTGTGSGGLTLRRHAPHIHQSSNPDAAQVTVTLRHCSSGETAKLTRTVKTSATFSLEPNSTTIRAAVDRIAQYPEVTLSRREIIRFILAEPGKRSEMVQAILNLEHLGQLRSAFNRSKNELAGSEKSAASAVQSASDAVNRHFDIPAFTETAAIAAIDRHRAAIGLPAVTTLDPTGIEIGIAIEESSPVIVKPTAIRDVSTLISQLSQPRELLDALTSLDEIISPILRDPLLTRELLTTLLIDTGIELVIDEACPLCDHVWPDPSELRDYLHRKRVDLESTIAIRDQIAETSQSLVDSILQIYRVALTVHRIALDSGSSDTARLLESWLTILDELNSEVSTIEGVLQARDRLVENPLHIPPGLAQELNNLLHVLQRIPDASQSRTAIQFLAVARERLTALSLANDAYVDSETASTAAAAIYNAYCSSQDHILNSYYERVEADFSKWYRLLNHDEPAFKSEFSQSEGKLSVQVDFYGHTMVAPGAYHSEGHQDAMGLCLYLALMKQRLGTEFRLAILDDVVMSIDAGHRRSICELLKSELSDVQFILTTHDPIWARQLRTLGVVPSDGHLYFSQWSVDTGPLVTGHSGFWNAIDDALAINDVPRAAACLRYSLEQELSEFAAAYRCYVPFHQDGQYGLGELANAVIERFGKLLGRAAGVASSRNDVEASARVKELKDKWRRTVRATEVERWAINPALHFNSWATFSPEDFGPIVAAWKCFVEFFECPACTSRYYITQRDSSDSSLRCDGRHLDLDL